MSEEKYRAETAVMDRSGKEALFRDNHPVVRQLREIPEIVFDESDLIQKENILPLKELFLKKNMDRYHVDCLVLYKIAANMARVQQQLMERHIYPGLFDPEDVLVNLEDSGYPLYLIHPDRFQLLDLEQDYEWYPEDERLLGELELFDEKSQLLADQRFLYRILVGGSRGNLRTPPADNGRDYSSLFYGTLPPAWKEIFEQGMVLSPAGWALELDKAVRMEESYEDRAGRLKAKDLPEDEEEGTDLTGGQEEPAPERTVTALFVLLRTERSNSLEISRMLYEVHDTLETEQKHGRFRLLQGFVYGDGVVKKKEPQEYPPGYRVQIPHSIREYDMVEALLIVCDRMEEMVTEAGRQKTGGNFRLYILADGKIENNPMFRVCLDKLKGLAGRRVQIQLIPGRDSFCEGWEKLKKIIAEEENVSQIKSIQ